MKEAKLRRVNWPDVNKEIFIRLCEFAYLQDYTPPAFEQRPPFEQRPNSEVDVKNNHEFWDGWDSWTPMQRRKKEREASKRGIPPRLVDITSKVVGKAPEPEFGFFVPESKNIATNGLPFREHNISDRNLRDAFSELDYTPAKQTYQFNPTSNTGPNQDFTPVFFGHTELYILADK